MDFYFALLTLAGLSTITWCQNENTVVQLDLQGSIVRGYSPYISFIQSPTWSTGACDSQAVVKVDLSGPYKGAELTLHYGKSPRLWTLDISDSPTGDGYGDDDGTTSNMAEVQILNRQMRIYGNILPGFMDTTSDGGLLIKTIDGFATKGSKATITISDERVDWSRGKMKDFLESKYLFTLNGQKPLFGDVEYDVYFGFNRVVGGTFRNGSGLCFVTIKLIAYPGNECATKTLQCHPDADCIDSIRFSRCRCKRGFNGDGHKCVDKNECNYKNGGCVHFCHNTKGNYTCACRSGFQLDLDKRNCIDVNECFIDKGGCQQQCVNTLGGYECKCNEGYSLEQDGRTCKLGSWCNKHFGCEHSCITNQQGAVICTCRDGYMLHSNGQTCSQTCRYGNGGCQHNCTDIQGGVICSCAVDYILTSDQKTCIATCMISNAGCQKKCKDTPNGPLCSCPPGNELHQDQKSCLDIDECFVNKGGCSHDCINLDGDYECVCPSGYKLKADRKTCEDIDECEIQTTCDHICINSQGSYSCACRPGYAQYGISRCADHDECSDNNGGCEQWCKNSIGTYTCLCSSGFKLHSNGKDCVVENKCAELRKPPDVNMSCRVRGEENICVLKCEKEGRFVKATEESVMTTHCGPGTQYRWDHDVKNITLPSCSSHFSSPNLSKTVAFKFLSKKCKKRKMVRLQMTQNITDTLNSQKVFKCENMCIINDAAAIKCERLSTQRGQMPTYSITVEFNITYQAQDKIKSKCDARCEMKKTEQKLKKVIKKLRKIITRNDFVFSYAGEAYMASKKAFKSPRKTSLSCKENWVLLGDICVGCSKGYFYDKRQKVCSACLPGYYQDKEAQHTCSKCPNNENGVGIYGAVSEEECNVQCEPSHFSVNGMKPCTPCSRGTFQPEYGRLSCQTCGGGLTTKTNSTGLLGFENCETIERCNPGYYYDVGKVACVPCAKEFYQPRGGQNFCIRCPYNTYTDNIATTDVSECKSRECGEIFNSSILSGVIQSPNYPGNYPANITCTWKIEPEKNRRILIIIPEVDLPKSDKCGDKLVMRKSKNAYSRFTYETCETSNRPIALSARSKKLWIQFQSDIQNTAKGFSIPFVTYNPDYQRLIESIVEDGRLYSSFQHQSVLKNRKLLTPLMEVIAEPQMYFQYGNKTNTIMPPSLIKLLTKKVIKFFQT